MKSLLFLAACLIAADASLAGTVSGTVRAQGKEGTGSGEDGGSYSSKKFKFAERVDYDQLRPFVVYIQGEVPGAKLEHPLAYVHQKDAEFVPHILPIMAGTTVQWPNDDPIFHNVYSRSDTATFDLGLYKKGDKPQDVTFTKPGEVDVFCSIHARMSCIILVLENPYFVTITGHGKFSIPDVPAGKYTLVAWQERLPKAMKEIVVPENGDVTDIQFVLGPKSAPQH
ncbi:MAG TPA: hypothetical protein VGO59_14985 [Verrucomicrobiae bacterium]|jgi:plastocyanin